MVMQHTKLGLILSAGQTATTALGELAACCDWPVLLQATPRRVQRELLLQGPEVLLIWLDDLRDMAATVRLLEWLSGYRSEVRRLAIAYQLGPAVELAIRGAGVHYFVALDSGIHALLNGPVSEWLASTRRVEQSGAPHTPSHGTRIEKFRVSMPIDNDRSMYGYSDYRTDTPTRDPEYG